MADKRWLRRLAIVAEAFVLLLSGASLLIYAASTAFSLYFSWELWPVSLIMLVIIVAPLFSVARRSLRSLRRFVSGEAQPLEFFSWDWNSGSSFLIGATIIGTMAAIAVPQRSMVIEKGRAEEAIEFVTRVRTAQDARFAERKGYASSVEDLGLVGEPLRYFDAGPIKMTGGPRPHWSIELTRKEGYRSDPLVDRLYGQYRIIFDSNSAKLACAGEKMAACEKGFLR